MLQLMLLLTGAVVLLCMAIAYGRTRDPLHPLMFLGPMLIYFYVVRPWMVAANNGFDPWLTSSQLGFAQFLYTTGVVLFCTGVLAGSGSARGRRTKEVKFVVSTPVAAKLRRVGCVLGAISVSAFIVAVTLSGGFVTLYSRAKARFSSGSGWIDELVNLSIPAVALLVLSWQGKARRRHHLLLALFFASPLLIHGLLGARRGPTFIILAAGLVSWFVTSPKRVALWKPIAGFGAACALILFLYANRQLIHLGSEFDFSWDAFMSKLAPETVDSGDDTVFLYGFVNGVRETGRCYWGVRYLATYLVRPIPRQLWPTKYEDLGLGWMVGQTAFAGITNDEWTEILGWVPQRGSATGFIADLYLEFSWLGFAGCFLLGWFFGRMWRNAALFGGIWTLLFIQSAALSIYVPTQSVSAVFHRFLLMSVPTALMWKLWIARTERLHPVRPKVRWVWVPHPAPQSAPPTPSQPVQTTHND